MICSYAHYASVCSYDVIACGHSSFFRRITIAPLSLSHRRPILHHFCMLASAFVCRQLTLLSVCACVCAKQTSWLWKVSGDAWNKIKWNKNKTKHHRVECLCSVCVCVSARSMQCGKEYAYTPNRNKLWKITWDKCNKFIGACRQVDVSRSPQK